MKTIVRHKGTGLKVSFDKYNDEDYAIWLELEGIGSVPVTSKASALAFAKALWSAYMQIVINWAPLLKKK